VSGSLLDLRAVGKTYGRGRFLSRPQAPAVRAVSFSLDVEKPEVFAVIGESGS
jgi:ABC-type oligopeptide transport system ATPase subunit